MKAKYLIGLLAVPLLFPMMFILMLGGAGNPAAGTDCGKDSSVAGGEAFTIGTMNWRGASHYESNPRPGERPYHERVPNMVDKIRGSGASIVGFQEFEPVQAEAFRKATAGGWGLARGKAWGGRPDTSNAIAYRTSAWHLDQLRSVKIKYGTRRIRIPLARFTSLEGSGAVWVLNTHNPANVVGGTARLRAESVKRQAGALKRLQDAEPNTPLLFTGDMNDRGAFKRMFLRHAGAGWKAANPDVKQIDWIMAGPGANFAGTTIDASTNDGGAKYSDHPYIHATVELSGTSPAVTSSRAGATSTGSDPGDGMSPARGCTPCPIGFEHSMQGLVGVGTEQGKAVAAAAFRAGFRGEDLVTIVAIALVESSWNPDAVNGTHYGLWQISAQHHGLASGWVAPGDIFKPAVNARYAYSLYQRRPGASEAKFADWIPFETVSYRTFLDKARIAVASGTKYTVGSCTSTSTVIGSLAGTVAARAQAMVDNPGGLCALSWTSGAPCTYDNQCPKVVDALYGGAGRGRGYGNGYRVAGGIITAGLAQASGRGTYPLPPVGAVVSYDPGNGVGHVAVYVGEGKIFGNDYGCQGKGSYGCVGYADIDAPAGSVTWALPKAAFDLGGAPD